MYRIDPSNLDIGTSLIHYLSFYLGKVTIAYEIFYNI